MPASEAGAADAQYAPLEADAAEMPPEPQEPAPGADEHAGAQDGGDSDSSSSEESDAAPMSEAEGESSADEDEGEAHASARGRCGQFVWPCPREYPSHLDEHGA